MKKNLILIKILAILSIVVSPGLVILSQKDQTAYANASSSRVSVIASALNVRLDADISGKIIGKVHRGDTFEIIKTKNSWDQIKLANNQTGWVYHAYVTPTKNFEATVDAPVLNVRRNPDFSSIVTGKLKFGTKITVQKEQSGWAKMESSSGVQGWVYEAYISKEALISNPSQPAAGTPTSKTTRKKSVSRDITDKKNLSQSTNPSVTSGQQATDQSMKTESTQNSQKLLKGKTVVLDPGHGGIDDGTTSITGTPEKTLTLATAKVVAQKLENAGANVIMTRANDTYISLQQRSELSKQNHADAFISFHYNWSNDPLAKGMTDFYYQESRDNLLASDILSDVVKTTNLNTDGTTFDNLDVLRNNTQPSTLIELGFLSNKQDDSLVESSSYRDKVAEGVYLGLLDYFSSKNK